MATMSKNRSGRTVDTGVRLRQSIMNELRCLINRRLAAILIRPPCLLPCCLAKRIDGSVLAFKVQPTSHHQQPPETRMASPTPCAAGLTFTFCTKVSYSEAKFKRIWSVTL